MNFSHQRKQAPRRVIQIVRFAMLWPLFSAALSGAIAQTLLPVRATGPAAGFVELAWTTDGGFHELQSTPTLTDPDWRVVLRSEQTGFGAPVSGRAAFFRVLSLPGWEERQVTDARRIEVLAAIAGRVGELATEETDAAAAALELFLRGFEELEGIRVAEDGSMQARFTDGRPLWIINNRLPATDEQLAASGMFAPSRKAGVSTRGRVDPRLTATGTRPPTGVPESRRAAMFQASLPGLEAPMLASLGPAFAARGYDVVGGEASLENLLALEAEGDDLGVFYIDTHGGFGMARRAEPVPPGTAGDGVVEYPEFILSTSTIVTPESEVRHAEAFDLGELAYAMPGPAILGGDVVTVPKAHYCVTAAFFRNHLEFGRKSLVFIDACLGAHPSAGPFIQTCLDQGASYYAGWTESVQDHWPYFATRLFFDAALGGCQMFPEVQPRQRPFDQTAIRAYLSANGHDVDPSLRPARMVFFTVSTAADEFGLLAPSLQRMTIDEATGEVTVTGLFDPDLPVTVRVAGSTSAEISVRPETWTRLRFPLPAGQEPFAGHVTLLQNGHPSNAVPLTEWRLASRLTRTFTVVDPQPSSTIDLEFRLRADVHPYRLRPYEDPVFGGAGAEATTGSSARVVDASGIYRQTDRDRSVEWSLPAPIDLPLVAGFAQNPTGFRGGISVGPDYSVLITAIARARDGMVVTETIDGVPFSYPFDPGTSSFPPGSTTMVRPDYSIPGGEGSAAGDSGTFVWQSAPARYAPDESHPGYAE